jgi:PKD repeat protein
MTELSQKYMTAWFNYHLHGKSEYYSYLYGFYAEQDIDAGLIVRQVDTFPDENELPIDLMADFEASPLIGVAPLTVTFANTSMGAYSSSYWEFGDGDTSSLDHPTHGYNETGSYTVTLTIDGTDGKDRESKVGYINVYAHQLFVPFVIR